MAEIGASAVIDGIYMAPDRGEPMVSYGLAQAEAGRGLRSVVDPTMEDRYGAQLGAWSKKPPSPGHSRELSVFSTEGLESALELARVVTGNPDLTEEELALVTRRNIRIKGFGPDLSHLIRSKIS